MRKLVIIVALVLMLGACKTRGYEKKPYYPSGSGFASALCDLDGVMVSYRGYDNTEIHDTVRSFLYTDRSMWRSANVGYEPEVKLYDTGIDDSALLPRQVRLEGKKRGLLDGYRITDREG